MKIYQGIGAVEGICFGKAVILNPSIQHFPKFVISGEARIENELERVRMAVEEVRSQLAESNTKNEQELQNENISSILEVHRTLLKDKRLVPVVNEKIRTEKINAEWALEKTLRQIEQEFAKIESPYIRSRFLDIEQIVEKLIACLKNEEMPDFSDEQSDVILICSVLSPSDVFSLMDKQISGLVMENGGLNSHASIICRELKIPLIVGINQFLTDLKENEPCIMDGEKGEFIYQPDEETIRQKQEILVLEEKNACVINSYAPQFARLKDGMRVVLEANLDFRHGLEELKNTFVDGIGLLRTEFTFLNFNQAPSEDEQYEELKFFALQAEAPLCIRTWDLGADKTTDFFPRLHREENPAMGLRAIRFCMKEKEFFRVQIRAILRLSKEFEVKMMIPMITNLQELIFVQDLIQEEIEKLNIHEHRLKLGAMIETPAAAVVIKEILEICDFISIGSNDLVQYVIAVDRNNDYVNTMYSVFHPAVLKMLENIIAAANLANKPVSICGEASADFVMQMFLLGIGKVSFSMNMNRVNQTKLFLSRQILPDCQKTAFKLLSNRTLKENEILVSQLREDIQKDMQSGFEES